VRHIHEYVHIQIYKYWIDGKLLVHLTNQSQPVPTDCWLQEGSSLGGWGV